MLNDKTKEKKFILKKDQKQPVLLTFKTCDSTRDARTNPIEDEP